VTTVSVSELPDMPNDERRGSPAKPTIFTMDGREVTDEAQTVEVSDGERDLVYDSMEALVAEQEEVIELFDINAAVAGQGQSRPSGGNFAIATTSPTRSAEPAFDGVIDGSVTQVDGGRALLFGRHPSSRTGMQVPFTDEITPEMSAAAFAPGVLALAAPGHSAVSQFRLLKIKVEGIIDQLRYRSIAITSTRPGEGRTTTALNLAVVMSENPWLKIALLDLNFRKPDIGRIMRVPDGDPGLLHVLSGRATLDAALRKLEGRNLYMLHTGGLYESSMTVLNSPQFDVFLNRLYDAFDLVIMDAPPVLGQDDALVIKQKVDGVFMVMRAESTSIAEMNRAVARLGRERVLGVVLNHVQPREVA